MIDELCKELLHHLKSELTYPPPAGQRVWEWFWELDKGRQTGFGPNAISWSDLKAWQQLTGARPEPWEVVAMYQMGIYRSDPDYDPKVKVIEEEPVSFIKSLKTIKEAYDRNPNG